MNKIKKFRIKDNRVKGQITIIAALSITLIISFVAAVFKSVRISSINVLAQQACGLAAESVFAGYSNEILDEFDVLLLKKSDTMDAKLSQYIKDNIMNENNIELVTSGFQQLDMITDNGAENIRKEIVAYMKYGVMSDVVNEIMKSEKQVKKAEKVKDITDKINSCEESMYELDAQVLKLIELVEGLDTTESGFVIRNNKPVPVDDYFAKAVIMGDVSMSKVVIDNKKVYNAINNIDTFYINIDELFQDMIIDTEELYEIGDAESNESGVNSYAALYNRSYRKLEKALNETSGKITQALDVIEKFKTTSTQVRTTIESTEAYVEDSKEIIGQELYESVTGDLNDIKSAGTSTQRKMCDVEEIESALRLRKLKLDNTCSYLPELNITLKQENCLTSKSVIDKCLLSLNGLTNNNLKFDYSGVNFSSSSSGLSAIKKIYSTLTEGLLKLVLEDKEISDKNIKINDLASSLSGEYEDNNGFAREMVDTVLYDTYLLNRFQKYTDTVDDNGDYNSNNKSNELLDYTLEYILCGENSDKANLKETILKLSAIKEGMNLAYLLTDSEKKAQAMTLATSLLGFTGNMAVIKGGQYLILTVWAYGESILDLRNIFSGGKSEFIKTKNNWELSLDNLLKCNLNKNSDKRDKGMDYEEYLRMLLLIESPIEKQYQTLGAMEIRMISNGHSDFRMKDYVAAANGQAVFRRKGISGFYIRDISYSYM